MPPATLPSSKDATSLIDWRISDRPIAYGDAVATMGVSVGVAYFGVHGQDAQSLTRAADAALYEAKRAGKNRVLEAPAGVQRIPAM